jgi:hypothetical protein
MWFAGVHSDVGGTFEDDPRLPQIALKWVVDGALDAGLIVKPNAYRDACTLNLDNTNGKVHRMGAVWALLGYRRRHIPSDARVHDSVKARDTNYRHRIATTVTWDDPDWLIPRL